MATPANPLDIFVTYTPHFELHMADTVDKILAVQDVDKNLATTDRDGVDTLLINTRKDAHQIIDDVHFKYTTAMTSTTAAMAPISELGFTITEPNGTFFLQKLQNQLDKYNLSAAISGGAVFGLKIFFVGRTEQNEVKTISLSKIIFLLLHDMNMGFTIRGGNYQLAFAPLSTAATVSANLPSSLATAVAYTPKSISIKSTTVQDALAQLKQKLNDNYKSIYETELDNQNGARSIIYDIICDPKIDGKLSLVTKDSFYPGDTMKITFTPQEDIMNMIRKIVMSSGELCAKFGESIEGLKQAYHPGVKLPVYTVKYSPQDDGMHLTYEVTLYEGGGDTYEFNYYFSGPGKNVDVLEFDIKLPGMGFLVTNSKQSTPLHSNPTGQVPSTEPSFFSKNILVPDSTLNEITGLTPSKVPIDALSGDAAFLYSSTRLETTGYVKIEHTDVPNIKLGYSSVITAATAAKAAQIAFTIRGHLGLFERSITPPIVGVQSFGVLDGVWLKLNIFNIDGTPFFYTGAYELFNIECSFSGGKFTQILYATMMQKPEEQ